MNDNWLKNALGRLKGILYIGIGDLIGNAASAFFWFYIASVMAPDKYGEVHYFLGIATLASAFSLIGTQNTIIVHTAKGIRTYNPIY